MKNIYRKNLNIYFETITDFKHSANRLNKVLLNDVEKYRSEKSIYWSGTALVIGDWTGPTENGWELPFHTGTDKFTDKEGYPKEISEILSREFSLAYSQCYEALETFLKDCVDSKIKHDIKYRELIGFNEDY